MAFSTNDFGKDAKDNNCAMEFKGARWYRYCHASNLKGLYHYGHHTSFADGVNWKNWKEYHYSLKSTSMKIRPQEFELKK